MLTVRDKIALRKKYVYLLKEFIYGSKLFGQSGLKMKEIISEMRCEILKPFYKRTGFITLTSHDILFFDDLLTDSEM